MVAPDHNPFPKVAGKCLDQVGFIGKTFWIVRIDDEFRSLEFNLRNRNAVGHFLIDLILDSLSRSSINIK